MKLSRSGKTIPAMTIVFALLTSPVWGQGWRRDGDHRGSGRVEKRRDYIFDRSHHHNRYYPRQGHTIRRLPRDYHVFRYRNRRFFFHNGIWYRPSGSTYIVVRPPIGLTVPFLPSFYTTIWAGDIPYYYAGGVYYIWQPERRVYVVTEPPRENEVSEEPAAPERIFIYPKEGQSEEQQATDRYECHSWSATQTGFDPTLPGGNVTLEEYEQKQAEYQRAMKACLEARGYSVK